MGDVRPVMPNEERYALADAFSEANVVTPFAVRIGGPLDVERLAAAIVEFGMRHAAFQTGFRPRAEGGWEAFTVPGTRLSLERRAMPGANFDAVAEALSADLFVPVDIAKPPLARFILVEVGLDDHWFVNSLHHTINDGRSELLLREEVFALYAGRNLPPPPPPMAAYVDGHWRASPRVRDALDYWCETLAEVDATAVMPSDRNGPIRPNSLIVTPIGDGDAQAIRAAAKALDVTMFHFFYAAALVALTRLVDRPRLASAFQSAGRSLYPGASDTIGVFTNALMVAPEVDPATSFASFARTVRDSVRGALANEAAPYHEVIRATGVHAAVGFNKFPTMAPIEVPGLVFSAPEPLPRQYEYDFNFRLLSGDGGYRLVNYYRGERFSAGLAQAVGNRVLALMRSFAATPDAAIGSVAAGTVEVPAQTAGATAAEPLFAAFLAQAGAHPDAPALRFDGNTTSYAALDRDSRAVAATVLAAGVAPGDRVAILADRGPRLVAAMLGVSRAGAVIVNLDNAYPETRLAALVALARPKLLLWAGLDDAPSDAARVLAADSGLPLATIDGCAEMPALPVVDPAASAYYLFTSGSTGTPKCVATGHAPLVNFVRWQAERFGLTAADRFTMCSGLSHDPLMRDIFTPLSIGAELLIPRQEQLFEPRGLSGWCAAERPTVMHLTPPLGRLLVAGAGDLNLPLRYAFWGGDLLRPDLPRALRAIAPDVVSVNFYGATETPQAAGYFIDDGDATWRTLPVGTGSDGFALVVRDAAGAPRAVGEIGEVTVASPYLSQGYVEDGAIRPSADGGVYRTGDRGFHLPSGDVMLIGRSDDQIKIRGYRVELAEATALVEASPLVKAAAVLATPADANGDRQLVAHVVPADDAPGGDGFAPALLGDLSGRLPAYMMPQRIRRLDRLPLLPNGKLDRRTLAADDLATPVAAPARTAASDSERQLMQRWSQVLGRPVASTSESFASLSGDSLSFVQAYLALEEVAGSVPEGWQFLPIHALVADADANIGAARPRGRVVDIAMLIRAVAIVAVVGWHFQLLDFNRGVTTALVLASGMLFGSFQLSDALARRTPAPILVLVGRILAPVMLFTVALYAYRTLTHRQPDLSILLLYIDLIDFSVLTKAEWVKYEVVLWYVHCLIHMLLFLSLVIWAASRLRQRRIELFDFALGMFLFGCVTRFLLPGIWVPGWFEGAAPAVNRFSYLPTTHLATFTLGAVIIAARTPRQRQIAIAALLGFAAATGWLSATSAWLFVLLAGFAQLFLPHVRLPRWAAQVVFLLAGSSLFIYLTHVQFLYLFRKVGLGGAPLVGALVSVVLGIFMRFLWDSVSGRLRSWRRMSPADAVSEAI